MDITGRIEEQKMLPSKLARPESELVAIYGR